MASMSLNVGMQKCIKIRWPMWWRYKIRKKLGIHVSKEDEELVLQSDADDDTKLVRR